MINLFDRIYIRHDNMIVTGQGQQKLVITDKEFTIPYVEDRLERKNANIAGLYKSLQEVDEELGEREAFWMSLRLNRGKLLIIARRDYVAELLIQYWKSIFVSTTVESLYALYEIFVSSENMQAFREAERKSRVTAPVTGDETTEKLSLLEFSAIYNETGPVKALEDLEKRQLPFEFLLMSYLTDRCDRATTKVLFSKIDMIMKKNIVAKLSASREELLFDTHNYYLAQDGVEETLITDPLEYIKKSDHLGWILDTLFEIGNEDEILEKYSLNQIKFFFEVHKKLLLEDHDELVTIDFVINKQYAEMIRQDIEDQRGNYFATKTFLNKINGFLISYMYQLKRLNMMDRLALYELK